MNVRMEQVHFKRSGMKYRYLQESFIWLIVLM